MYRAAALLSLASAVRAQQVGTQQAETHPTMSWQTCTSSSACTTNAGQVVIDANWRWVHTVGGYTNCYTGNAWDTSIATSDAVAATACALDGADYSGTYGITSSGNALTLKFVTQGSSGANIGSRTYLMKDDHTYQIFQPLGKEFSFDVDLSNVPCGLNAALYFVSMDADGGMAKYPNNKAGAKYGTGYCDSQCPRDLKFINGQGNVEGWTASTNDKNSGIGNHGSCCAEFDVWESNKISAALTPHPCTTSAQTMCTTDGCGGTYSSDRYAGVCDPDGCDFNSYRMGNHTFYGPGMTVDTSKKFTVTTQFVTNSAGTLSEIKRFYVQNGKAIANSASDISGVTGNSITESFCDAQKKAFGDTTSFQDKGGMTQMSDALKTGMVLVMSLWDDHYANMLWLDSTYPTNESASTPGVGRGTCATTSGAPADVESANAGSSVVYSNIRFGPIGSTTGGVTV